MRKLFTFPTFIAAVFGVGFGASVFLNVQQATRSSQDAKLMQGTITDLRYQVDQDKKQLAGGTSPTPSPSPSDTPVATPEPSPTPAPAGQVAGASTSATSVFKYACNLRSSAGGGSIMQPYTYFKTFGLQALPNSLAGGAWQSITFNGQRGYVQAACLK